MTRRGFNMLIDTKYGPYLVNRYDTYISGSLIHYGEYSEHEMAFLRSCVPVGGVVIQAGAHIGALTIPLAQHVGPDGMVVAFEPQRLVFQLLCANIALGSFEHVQAVHAGVGRELGTAIVPQFDPSQASNSGGTRLIPDDGVGEGVMVCSLDSYVTPPRLDLIHADVEGMEEDVLIGANNLIRRYRPVLYVESIDKDKRASLCECMRALGYRLWHHAPLLYNPDNYAGFTYNMFPGIVSPNILAWPLEREPTFDMNDVHLRHCDD